MANIWAPVGPSSPGAGCEANLAAAGTAAGNGHQGDRESDKTPAVYHPLTQPGRPGDGLWPLQCSRLSRTPRSTRRWDHAGPRAVIKRKEQRKLDGMIPVAPPPSHGLRIPRTVHVIHYSRQRDHVFVSVCPSVCLFVCSWTGLRVQFSSDFHKSL